MKSNRVQVTAAASGIDRILKDARRGDLRSVKTAFKTGIRRLLLPRAAAQQDVSVGSTRGKRVEVVRFLLHVGADPNVPGRPRSEIPLLLKPYCIALRYRRLEIARMLVKAGSVMEIYSACYLGDADGYSSASRRSVSVDQGTGRRLRLACDPVALCGDVRPRATQPVADQRGALVKPYTRLLCDAAVRMKHAHLIPVLVPGAPTGIW